MPRNRSWDHRELGPLDPIFRRFTGGHASGAVAVGNTPNASVTIEGPAPVEWDLEVLEVSPVPGLNVNAPLVTLDWEVLVPTEPAPAFSPADLPGLVLWTDAADTASITDSSGTVTAWADKSPDLRTIELSGTLTTNATTLNGHNVVEIDGTSYIGTSAFLYDLGDFTLYLVMMSVDDIIWFEEIGGGAWETFAHPRIRDYAYLSTNTQIRYYNAGGGTVFNINNSPGWGGSPTQWTHRVDQGGSPELQLYADDSLRLSVGSFTPPAGLVWARFAPGGNGYIAEIIAYDSAHDATDRATVQDYLVDKWGL